MARDPEDYSEPESEIDDEVEREDRIRRIADANIHYDTMNVLLDGGIANRIIVFHAYQVLKHGMRALISAHGHRYPHGQDLNELANVIEESDCERDWRFVSDLSQLSGYAEGDPYRYMEKTNPVTDCARMANAITDDIELIYRRIQETTGEDPWSVPPDENSEPVSPRRRAGLTDSL